MAWVMPPASPAATLLVRMASSREVLPWSTWPMMVTTGGRQSFSPTATLASSAEIWTSSSKVTMSAR